MGKNKALIGLKSGPVDAGIFINTVISNPRNIPAKCKSFRQIHHPAANFVGREKLLEDLHQLLASCATKTPLWERIVVIHGLGGIGKSELVRTYVEKHKHEKIIQNVAWIDSDSESSLEKSFKKIAGTFGLETKDVNAEDLANSVFEYFSENFESGLFIFDNAEQLQNEEQNFGILNYLPTQHAKLPLIIITSRNNDWEASGTIAISELSEDQSVQLLEKKMKLHVKTKNDKQNRKIQVAVRNLAEELQGYPLGLILAAANICFHEGADVAYEIENYISFLNKPGSGFLYQKRSKTDTSKCTQLMINVWEATIDKVKHMTVEGECALTLLNIVGYLPTTDIRKSRVANIIEFGYSPLKNQLARGYDVLVKCSLITFDNENEDEDEDEDEDYSLIQVHRHVQRCTRESLDSVRDHSYLLSIGRFLCEMGYYGDDIQIHIHRYLKQRKWPDDSLSILIVFLWDAIFEKDNDSVELAKDLGELSEAIDSKNPDFSHLFRNGFRTLIKMALYILSELHDEQITLPDTKRSHWNTKYYEKKFDAALRLFTNYVTKNTPTLPSGICNTVMDKIKLYLGKISEGNYKFRNERILIKIRESLLQSLDDPTTGSRLFLLKMSCDCLLQRYRNQEEQSLPLNLKKAIHLHLKYYTSDNSLQNMEYWDMGGPIHYDRLRWQLQWIKLKRTTGLASEGTDLEKSILDAFVFNGGLQLVQQHIDHIISDMSQESPELLNFIMCLVTEHICSEEFKKSPKFLHSLKKLTKMAFSMPKSGDTWPFHAQWLLLWFALFPGNHIFEDPEGRKWSLDSVNNEIKKFSCILDNDFYWTSYVLMCSKELIIQALRAHLELSESNPRDGWVFKAAVEIMGKDIRGRLNRGNKCDAWRAEFENNFKTQENIPQEIRKVGIACGFMSD